MGTATWSARGSRSAVAVGVVMAGVLVLLATGSAAQPRPGQSLMLGRDRTTTCVLASTVPGEAVVFGGDLVENVGRLSVTLTSVALHEPDGLALREAHLMPLDESTRELVGYRHERNMSDLPTEWERRVPAAGVRIAPGERFNVVAVVDGIGAGLASAEGLTFAYTVGDERFAQTSASAMQVADGPCR